MGDGEMVGGGGSDGAAGDGPAVSAATSMARMNAALNIRRLQALVGRD